MKIPRYVIERKIRIYRDNGEDEKAEELQEALDQWAGLCPEVFGG